jgi:hypothetical protein
LAVKAAARVASLTIGGGAARDPLGFAVEPAANTDSKPGIGIHEDSVSAYDLGRFCLRSREYGRLIVEWVTGGRRLDAVD